MEYEVDIDHFAGGGGSSTGIESATGRPVDYASNHDRFALAVHTANHPDTVHLHNDIWEIDAAEFGRAHRIRLAWLSPDCTHFSKAKGAAPIRDPAAFKSRALGWVAIEWARKARPRIIVVENVEEWLGWGPLGPNGRPDPARRGETFHHWFAALLDAGYNGEYRELRACDYGSPTIRKRLVVIARRDRQPIVWPKPTHGPGRPHAYRTAAQCLNWLHPVNSIFLDSEEARRIGCRRPLADATLARIARGTKKYVLDTERPFIVPITHSGDTRVHSVDTPLRTITCAHRGELALARAAHARAGAPTEIELAHAHAIGLDDRRDAAAAFLMRHFGNSTGQPADTPIHTITAHGGGKTALVAACLSHQYSSNSCGGDGRIDQPMKTITTGGHAALVNAFLMKYYSEGGQHGRCDQPAPTVTTRDRLGLVGVARRTTILDIGMRMLTPRELFTAQGFPRHYVIDPVMHGKPLTKTKQIYMVGNSVCPQMAEAVVRANVFPHIYERQAA